MSNIAVAQEATVFIYGLCDPRDGKVKYIGKAKDLQARLKSHFKGAGRTNTLKNAWLLKLKSNGLKPEIVVLERVQKSVWSEAERWWIDQYRRWEPGLKNMDDGGRGRTNYVVSAETRKRLSIANHRRWGVSAAERAEAKRKKEEVRRLQPSRRGAPGVPRSAECRRKISLAQKGKIFSAETRAKMSAAKQGWKPSERMTEIQREKCKGEGNGRALLTEAQVLEIRERYTAGNITYQRLAEDYPVTLSTIHRIVKRRRWKHV